ncbi:hypothetical protein ANO11243_051140 [Dothideomycetidae sp. 11243]|nr:hypothetical protein ANO11243_051140 [fungal sp. No.11243]
MPLEPVSMVATFALALSIPFVAHGMRSFRREFEDFYDYRRMKKGLPINAHRERARKRLREKDRRRYETLALSDTRTKDTRRLHSHAPDTHLDADCSYRDMRRGYRTTTHNHQLSNSVATKRRFTKSRGRRRRVRAKRSAPLEVGYDSVTDGETTDFTDGETTDFTDGETTDMTDQSERSELSCPEVVRRHQTPLGSLDVPWHPSMNVRLTVAAGRIKHTWRSPGKCPL